VERVVTERQALIVLNRIAGIGAITVKRMQEAFGSAVGIFKATQSELAQVYGIGREKAALFYSGMRKMGFADEEARAERLNVRLVTWVDDGYPAILREIADPPLVLYVAGEVEALSGYAVAIVGTRQATLYGRETALRFGCQLAAAGYVVVSGLARGIDTEAHRGALQAHGRTVAVLGGALDRIFPPENEKLARTIAAGGGALVSEYPFGRQPDKQTFPMRNRIISGLSRGVLVVESPLSSGTMITVGQALDQNRVVMAVPGRIDTPTAAGCHRLLRDGARLVTSADDVREELHELLPRQTIGAAGGAASAAVPAPILNAVERQLLELLEHEQHVDVLIRSSGLGAARVNALLVSLQLRRLVDLLPGGFVKRAALTTY